MSEPATPSHRLSLGLFAALVTTTLAVYWPALGFGFINYDDPDYVTGNPHILGGLTLENVKWAFTTGATGNWHPLTWMSLMLDAQVYQGRAFGFHLTNIVLHSISVGLLFLALARMTAAPWRSAMTAAVFAIHPLRVESVVWVTERKDVLSTLLGLMCMLAYIRYVRAPSLRHYWLVPAMLALSLMSKSMMVTLPCVLLLLDYWPLGRFRMGQTIPVGICDAPPPVSRSPTQLVLEKVPLLALSLASSLTTYLVQKHGNALTGLAGLSLSQRLSNVLVGYLRYIGNIFWPHDLSVFYPYPAGWPAWRVAGAATAIALVTVVAIVRARRNPWLLVGWLWFLGTLVPAVGFIQSGLQSLADRYTYFSSIGVTLMVTWSIPAASRLRSTLGASLTIAGAGLLVALVISTRSQMRYWTDSITLFRHALAVTENNWLAYGILGDSYRLDGRYAEAADAARAAVNARPEFFEGYCNLGNALAAQGLYTEAIQSYQTALKVHPNLPEAHYNIGSLLLTDSSRARMAADAFRRAVELRPSYVEAHIGWARALAQLDRATEAVERLRAALVIDPANADALYRLGVVLSGQQRHAEANDAYREAVRINPKFVDASNALAWSLATTPGATERDGKEAVEVITAALKLPDAATDPNLIDTLAAAQARAGLFSLAAESARRALALARERRLDQLVTELTERMAQYEGSQAYTQSVW